MSEPTRCFAARACVWAGLGKDLVESTGRPFGQEARLVERPHAIELAGTSHPYIGSTGTD